MLNDFVPQSMPASSIWVAERVFGAFGPALQQHIKRITGTFADDTFGVKGNSRHTSKLEERPNFCIVAQSPRIEENRQLWQGASVS